MACSETPTIPTSAVWNPRGVVITDGNSLTQSRNGVVAMPIRVQEQLGSLVNLQFINAGENGHTTAQMLTTALSLVDPLYRSNQINLLIAWEGANDLYFGATPGQAFAHLCEYGTARQKAGFTVVMLTLIPRGDVGAPASYEADRQIVNARLRAEGSAFMDRLIDIGADPIMGNPDVITQGIYIDPIDHAHLTDAGSRRVATMIVAGIRPFLN